MVPQPPPCRGPNLGFVTAMHARFVCGGLTRHEWIIVARWGAGDCLSVGLTGTAVAGASIPPEQLSPKHSLFAHRCGLAFKCKAALPEGVTLAGIFIPTSGTLRLFRRHPDLTLRGAGACVSSQAPWRLAAVQAPWVGAFIEAPCA